MADSEAEAGEEDGEEAAAKAAAEAAKKLGTDAYKKRDFAAAVTHFSGAWEAWPKDITFLTNLGGGYIPVLLAHAGAKLCSCRVYLRSCIF
jgi:hypothetical protein